MGASIKSQESSYSSSSSYQTSSSSSSEGSGPTGSRTDYVYSGWRMLPNGTYIRVYDNKKSSSSSTTTVVDATASGAGQQRAGSASSSSSYSSQGSAGGRGGYGQSSETVVTAAAGGNPSDTAAEGGSRYRGSSSDSTGGGVEVSDSGWIKLPDGTWTRQSSSSYSSSSRGYSGSTGSMNGGGGGAGYSESLGSDTYRSGSSGSDSYRYGSSGSDSYRSSSSGSDSYGMNYGASGSSRAASSGSGNYGGSSSSRGGGASSSGLDVVLSAAQGPGNYHGTMSKAELEREAGGPIFSSRGSETRHQVANTRYQGSELEREDEDEEEEGYYDEAASSGRGGGTSSSSSSSSSSSKYSGEGEDYVTTTGGKWVWSEVNKKWEWEAAAAAASSNSGSSINGGSGSSSSSRQQQEEESGSSDSGWTILPNGTYVRQVSSWSRTSSSSGGGGGGGGAGRQGYFETGSIGGSRNAAGGSSSNAAGGTATSSGWVMLANGTYVRRQQQQQQQSGGSAVAAWGSVGDGRRTGDLGTGSVVSPQEYGDQGSNTTGWVRQPDGSMVRKSSSWASWSSANYEEMDENRLEDIQQQLNERARSNIRRPPANVEPGFEDQYFRAHRSLNSRKKRSLAEFQAELEGCDSKRCTILKCRVGPLEKDESVLFRVRSRLYTETQVKNYAEKVKISSKLLTRVTKLPFSVQEDYLAFQSHTVTTTVIPSEPGEVGTPWWVWLLAALAGILLLALITYALYKCGFFKRRRPEDSPETEPLNGGARNGY